MGPAAFFGLCIYALVTAGPAPMSDDPRERMDMTAASAGASAPMDPAQVPSPARFAYLEQISRASAPGIAPPGPEADWRIDPPLPRQASFEPENLGVAAPGVSDLPVLRPARRVTSRWIAGALHAPRAMEDTPRIAALPLAQLTADKVHLRAAPSARAAVLGQFDMGTEVQVIGPAGNWTKVVVTADTAVLTGWFYTKYLAP